MESQKGYLFPQLQEQESNPAEALPTIERTIPIKIVHNYTEKTLLLPSQKDLIETIKKQAEELFSLTSVRLEIDSKPLLSPEQIFSIASPKITVLGIKNKCFLSSCQNRASSALLCKYCTRSFCNRHSIPEEHVCEKIDQCKEEAASINKKKILQGVSRRNNRF